MNNPRTCVKQFLFVTCAALTSVLVVPGLPARADGESWNALEIRIPSVSRENWEPVSLRVVTSSRFGFRYPGLGVSNLRVGPLWQVAPWMLLGLHGSAYAEQIEPGHFRQMLRLEAEPNLQASWGNWQFNDRNRIEWRYTPTDAWWRYRNQVRATYQPSGWQWWPTVSQEFAWDLRPWQMAQSRLTLGVSRILNRSTRLTLEYLWRGRPEQNEWATDHIANVTLFFAPDINSVKGGSHAGGE
jgi:hypothetical protein